MERAVAIKKLGKILGKKLGYRVDPKALSRDEREVARIECLEAVKERKELEEKKNARSRAILEADAEYQRLAADHKAARERAERLGSMSRRQKITVGTSEGIFFRVMAEGDSWEEVIEKLTAKKQAA